MFLSKQLALASMAQRLPTSFYFIKNCITLKEFAFLNIEQATYNAPVIIKKIEMITY
jgi:hypothetical protein